ncbi:MAG: 4Fe-4S dicluster domain-containing protein [Candidatus Rokubacteria bacterium]|nr:4Fe-4S dicluster domain-containing protein [Candidatus Rokubacteria bacterium]
MRYGMVIDLKRCFGCYGCQLSCKAEHATPPGVFFARVVKRESGTYPNVRKVFLPLLCMHCETPPCEAVCPTGATSKRPDGIVDIDREVCVGCRYCMQACPYEARYFHAKTRYYFGAQGPTEYEAVGYAKHPTGVVMKCNFCAHRLARGEEPSCVLTCPTHARTFGDLDDPQSAVSRLIKERGGEPLHPELGTGPSVYYLPA